METGLPEWTPMPETVARAPSVVCLPDFMSPSRNPLVNEPLVAAPSSPVLPFQRPRGTCFAALREIAEALLRPSPNSLLSRGEPDAKKLNTGRNAANSRFFSDCYSGDEAGNRAEKWASGQPYLSQCGKS
jgi:hypothetical protein